MAENRWRNITNQRIYPVIVIANRTNQNLCIDLRLHQNQITYCCAIDYLTNKQKFYIKAIYFWLIFNIIRFSIYLVIGKHETHPIYFLDITRIHTGLLAYKYLWILSGMIFTLRIFYLLTSNKYRQIFDWIEIINLLRVI
jgi:hypothetical protein